jgi:hypothetical protein
MTLYHGSNVIVKTPKLLPHNRNLDFVQGFYTTTNKKQAVRFAGIVVNRRGGEAIISSYFYAFILKIAKAPGAQDAHTNARESV